MDTPASDGTMPCPAASPTGLPCTKPIPHGWTADEGHGGTSQHVQAVFDGGHFDASPVLTGLPFEGHLPADLPGCSKETGR